MHSSNLATYSYMKERLTLDKVNATINDTASYADANAQLIAAPRKKVLLRLFFFSFTLYIYIFLSSCQLSWLCFCFPFLKLNESTLERALVSKSFAQKFISIHQCSIEILMLLPVMMLASKTSALSSNLTASMSLEKMARSNC